MGGLKGLFFKEEAVTKSATPETNKTVAPAVAQAITLSSQQLGVASTQEKNEFISFLNEVYQKGNFDGPDFQEFTDALKEVASLPMDEKTKFTTIFISFKVQGVTKARLVDTGTKYIDLINKQVADFNNEIETVMKSDVSTKQTQADKLTKENADLEQQMITLTEKKNRNSESIKALTNEINDQVISLNSKKTAFESAAKEFIGNINDNLTKIQTYIPEK